MANEIQEARCKCNYDWEKLHKQLKQSEEIIRRLIKTANHWSVCDYPEEVRFRCVDCRKAERLINEAQKFLSEREGK